MTLAELQSIAPTIAGQPVEFHACSPVGVVLWMWGDSLAETHCEVGETAAGLVARLVEMLTPPEITVRAEDGTVIAADGTVVMP